MLHALGDAGEPVDWWFAYKLPLTVHQYEGDPLTFVPSPANAVPAAGNDGYRYLYYEPGAALALSSRSLAPHGPAGAVTHTLQHVFGSRVGHSVGWVAYNDEEPTSADLRDAHDRGPGSDALNLAWGHSKGVLAFDLRSGSGCWLVHSFPRWPAPGQTHFPGADERSRLTYAQSFLCLSLPDLSTVATVAKVLHGYVQPQTVSSRLPDGSVDAVPDVCALAAGGTPVAIGDGPTAAPDGEVVHVSFGAGRAGGTAVPVELYAKSSAWHHDFWSDLVAHDLGVDLDVESWRRLSALNPLPPVDDGDGHDADDGYAIHLADPPWYFTETEDHSKWAVGAATDSDVVAVGDMNRTTSQEIRGGCAVVLRDAALAGALRQTVLVVPGERSGALPGAAPSPGTTRPRRRAVPLTLARR